MVIDRDKHNKYVAIGFQPVQQVTGGTTLQSNTGNTSSTTSGSTGSSSTIVINGGGGMTSALEEKLSGIEAGALVNLNAYSNITILNGTVEAGTITALVETDTAKISTITPLVCNLIDGVILLTFDDTNYATKLYVIDSIDDLIGAAPGALDTLEELALALGDDPNFATTVTNMIASVTSRVDTIEDTYAKLTDITIANITDLNSNWDSLLLNTPTDYVTRWPNWGEVTDKPTWIGDTKPTYTAEEIGALTLATADNLYVSITGDTMQGPLTFLTSTEAYHKTGLLFNNDTSRIGCSTAGGIGIYAADGIYLRPNWVEDGTMYGVVLKSDTFTYNGYPILTSENYGQYIDIEAGGITQDIADSRYVNVTGDTMTGSLQVRDNNLVGALITDGSFRIIAATTLWARSLDCYSSDGSTLIGRIAGAYGGANSVDHYYFYGGTDFQNPYMIITPTGNVGIGTTSPTAKLSVNGDITIPYTKATADGSVPYAGSLIPNLTSLELVSNYKSFIGGVTVNNTWYWGINVRHRNGYGDGNLYGLWIYTTLTAAGSLAYKKQQGSWTTERVLLDSVNYTNYTVTKTGGGASGSWPISITGSAGYTNYLFDGSIRCRTINKNDNLGNPTWVLISNCSALFTSETAHGNYGFTGYCSFSRNGGYIVDGNALIVARIAYVSTHVQLETSETHITPYIVKYNNNYYVAFRLAGSNSSYRLTGVWYGCVDSFTQLNADSSGNVSGLSIVNVGTTYATFNASSANNSNYLTGISGSNFYRNTNTLIKGSDDWNTYTLIGSYCIWRGDGNTNLGTNCPPNSYGWGALSVLKAYDDTYVLFYFSHNADYMHLIRVKWQGGWSAWKKLAYYDSVIPKTAQIFGGAVDSNNNRSGLAVVYGSYNATATARYATSALAIRENSLVSAGLLDIAYAPSLGFWWNGRVASTLCMDSAGNFVFMNQSWNGYRKIYVNGILSNSTVMTYTNGTGSYDLGIRINRTSAANWATLTIGYVGTATTGTSANTWLIGTPSNSNGLLFCNNGSTTTSGLFLAGLGNSDMKWNNNVVINAANIGSYNAGSATRLLTARTITLTGAVTGSTTFNGAANVTITTKYNGSLTPYFISGNNSVLNPTLYNSTMFILLNGTSTSTRTVNLPSLGMMLTYVGSTSSWFAVLLTIVTCNTNYGTWSITKPTTASGATASNYYPKYFYNTSGGNVTALGLSGPGKRMQILLYYNGSTDYTAQQIC